MGPQGDFQIDFVFFKVAEGYGGHLQNLALFDASDRMFLEPKSVELSREGTTLHHIALNVALQDFEAEKTRLGGLGLKVNATVHEWLHVRSMYFTDPEGNLLEFVATITRLHDFNRCNFRNAGSKTDSTT